MSCVFSVKYHTGVALFRRDKFFLICFFFGPNLLDTNSGGTSRWEPLLRCVVYVCDIIDFFVYFSVSRELALIKT